MPRPYNGRTCCDRTFLLPRHHRYRQTNITIRSTFAGYACRPVARRPATVKKTDMLILVSLCDNRGLDKQLYRSVNIAKQLGVKRAPNDPKALFEQLMNSPSQPTTSEDIVQASEISVDDVSSQLDERSISDRGCVEKFPGCQIGARNSYSYLENAYEGASKASLRAAEVEYL